MATAVTVRADLFGRRAAPSCGGLQARQPESASAVALSRADAAPIGGMDGQTLRDWVHRFNERGPEGLKDSWSNWAHVGHK